MKECFKFLLVVAFGLMPSACEWVMDGRPTPEQAAQMLKDDVKEGWR